MSTPSHRWAAAWRPARWLLLLAAAALHTPLAAQTETATLRLRVSSVESRGPAAGAAVSLNGAPEGVTDAAGRLVIAGVPMGRHRLDVAREGHAPQDFTLNVHAADTVDLDVALFRNTFTLEGLDVVASRRALNLQEFDHRRAHFPTGSFVTKEEFRALHALRFTDLARGIPSLQVIVTPGGGYDLRFGRDAGSLMFGEGGGPGGGDCKPQYFVDGVMHHVHDPNAEFPLAIVEGVEFYPGTFLPARFGGSRAGCGAVVIWTRS